MAEVVLHDYWRSSASYRVRIALAMKGIAYTARAVSLLDGEQRGDANLAMNPQGLVPTLEIDGLVLTQSLAIIDYLDATRPAPPLCPADPAGRATALSRALLIAADIHPLNNLRVLRHLKRSLEQPQDAIDRWVRHWIDEGFAALEVMAGDGRYLGGDAPDVSDICLAPQLYNARRFDVAMARYPRLSAIAAALDAHPAVMAAHPDRFRPAD